ncbi:hypothetical protein PtA15_10A457 [Puccinia triticina]|uniref:Midasin n=1 Tax=Puccinia triticina TaxID=208348 RepID=A0ABY7CWL1_9BASI|nr:uncharacterized protein PtA15_10A457 [Puccinia triticina]WAQ89034.1 hypothetical protein PtA15_10A457 [Puccinia triticina]
MDLINDFDLLGSLYDFLHQIGLLPLPSASSTKSSTSRSAGTIINHHICSDIPPKDINFLLDLFNTNSPKTSAESFPQHAEDTVPRLLEILAQITLLPPFTCHVSAHFAPILSELAARWMLYLEFQDGGRYSDRVCSYWPTQLCQGSSSHLEESQSSAEKEIIKSNLRLIINAFSLLLPHHPSLFPLFVILMRHPALATDPFEALPVETLAPVSTLDRSLPINHPLYQSNVVDQFLLAITRLLLVSPHLPHPGLVLQGWVLPPVLLNILKFHPRRGTRQLAWYCWKFWQGSACSSQLIKQVKDQYIWQRRPSDPSLIQEHFSSPWSEKFPQNSLTDQDTPMDPIIDSSSDDMITIEEQLTCKWHLHVSGSPPQSTFSYEVVSRAIDAWVWEFDESHRILQLESCPKFDPAQRNVDLPLLFLQDRHLTKFIAAIEGNLTLKFHALPTPSSINNLLPATQKSMCEPRQCGSDILQHEDPFVSTSSSVVALRSISRLISDRFPVLLSGPPSSGKNTIIQKLAAQLWSKKSNCNHSTIDQSEVDQNIVILNLASRILDAKSLVGSYVSSTEDPGKFVFVEGPLLRAIKEGKWLVCQDIDRASEDVLSIINQLADLINHRAQYQVGGGYGGHGGLNGVGIDLGAQSGWGKSFYGEQYWKEVAIGSMTKDDILNVVARQTPNFSESVRDRLVAAWEGASMSQMDSSRRRPIQLIDLLKWITRIKALLTRNQALSSVSQNPVLQEQIFLEGVDLFFASSETSLSESDDLPSNVALNAAQTLGKHLDLNPERSTYCICRRVPDFIPPAQKLKAGSSGKAKTYVTIGRIKQLVDSSIMASSISNSRPFALTKSTLVLLERLAVSMRSSEPTLLVGETGTGKTTVVSYMANLVGKKLISLNLSNQSEASDLLGGFKPLDSAEDGKLYGNRLVDEFINTFGDAFNTSRNHEFVHAVRKAASKKKFVRLVALLKDGIRALSERLNSKIKSQDQSLDLEADDSHEPSKRRKTNISRASQSTQARLKSSLQDYLFQLNQFEEKFVRSTSNHMRFRFVEGPLVKALQNGDWVLLDEINLGTAETLEALSGLLRHPNASVILSERGDLVPVPRHSDFRLIGCMNPATDVGKRDLPASLRSKFTELYVQPPDNDREALLNIISQHLGGLCASDKRAIADTADCYTVIRTLARNGSLADGTNAPPHYSMRTLSRALSFATTICSVLCLRRALVEGFLMAFVTTLDTKSTEVVCQLIDRHIVQNGKNPKAIMSQQPKKPEDQDSYVQVGPFWLKKAQVLDDSTPTQDYVLTVSVKSKIIDLARAVTTGRWPVLIQGPTSSGKTSIVAYIARLTGHPFVRINNHEHTDIQEYIGSYATDPETGRLCFKEGALVRALRQGAWVVLDELNLAPSDVLEALNRLLDDNRELVIPETQEIVKPHPDFMLFATQNPPGLYGGRKVLSRAFRNRFIELHFDDVPKDELEIILCQRCAIAPSHANKIVKVFAELQRRRQSDKIFEQKHSFVTLRDLFRWGGRGAVGYQELAEDGYMLLAERSRGEEEKETVKQVLEEIMNVTIDQDRLYEDVKLPKGLVATNACKRLFKLVSRCLQFNEPVLLVGDAGSGKTSVCEAISSFADQRLRSINLHRNSEVGDLLGSQRPIRQRAERIQAALQQLRTCLADLEIEMAITDGSSIDGVIGTSEKALAEKMRSVTDSKSADQAQAALSDLKRSTALFDWSDGPLIQAMQEGDHVLLDEISLADDSVLERLNSLLEPERSIVLAERGGDTLEKMQITAHLTFQIFATMNPGGDFGKRELSPALRNRFTEIWVPLVSDPKDRFAIYCDRLSRKAKSSACASFSPSEWAAHIISFSEYYSKSPISAQFSACELSLRDGLAWCDFISSCSSLSPALSFVHGAQMTVLDRLGTAGFGQDLPANLILELRESCLSYLHNLAKVPQDIREAVSQVTYVDEGLKIGDFTLQRSNSVHEDSAPANYSFSAQTVAHNALRIIRALQVPKAVLLEGSPGVGKTSIVEALAKLSGKRLQRINLSDQTDLLDLFGADAPVEGGSPGQFEWKDATFLDALQKGDWVLLDEMNLAPQTVLEGLNGCLDYRGTVYVPEIDRTFKRHPDFRVFAAQNPHHQGGSRKGLPKSLVDRFTVVFMKEMENEDLSRICSEMAPAFSQMAISKMVNFNYRLVEETNKTGSFASLGSPWEFNLRDLGRWLQITSMNGKYDLQPLSPVEYIDMIYTGRFRTQDDQATSAKISREFFNASSTSRNHQDMVELPSELIIGHSRVVKPSGLSWAPPLVSPLDIPPSMYNCAEALIRCLELKWLPILTGTEKSGKSSLVKFLAARKGVQLRVISLHSGTDTSDLIGGFEQSNMERKLIAIIEDTSQIIQQNLENSSLCRDASTTNLEMSCRDLKYLKSLIFSFDTEKLVACVLDIFKRLRSHSLRAAFEPFEQSLLGLQTSKPGCRFEWIDGPLVTAMKKGQWLLVENSNLCSASVLDRLNPLFEGAGILQLAEKGMTRCGIDTVIPHTDFRIIFAFNPRYGELSRAMRNRGVEIAFLPDPQLSVIGLPLPLKITPLTSSYSIQHPVMRWTAHALIHSPTEYPLLSRTLDHFLPSSSPDHTLKLLLYRLLKPDILGAATSWAQFNRASHFFIGEAFDLAIASQSTHHLLDEGRALGHQSLLRLVIAACLPLRSLSHELSLESNGLKKHSSDLRVKHSQPIDHERVSSFVNHASDAVLRSCLLILGETQNWETLSDLGRCEYQQLFGCIRDIQEATLQLIDLLESSPDHAAIGFALKMIDDSVHRAPPQTKSLFESTELSLQPLRDSHDISRWEALVILWNLFCPPWYKNSHLVDLVGQLGQLCDANWSLLNTDLRAIYFEIVASLKISREITADCPKINWLTEKLKEQISAAKTEERHLTGIPPPDKNFGLVGERMIAIVATMTSFFQTKSELEINTLLPQWGTVPSEVGVLFRSKAYLQDQNASTQQTDLCLNLQIIMSLTAASINFCDIPFSILSQFTRSNFLHVISGIARLVKTSTTLEGHGAVVKTLDRLVSLVATTTPCLTQDRERLCHTLISSLLNFIEAPVIHLDGSVESQPSTILASGLRPTSRALRLWHLYISDVPIDPLSVQTAHHSYLQAWASRLSELRAFLASYQQTKGAAPSNPRMSQLDDELTEIQSRCKEIPQPSIQRSTDTLVQHAIFTELKAFEKQFLVDGRLEDLAQALVQLDNFDCLQSLHARIENFCFSAIGLINRLSKRFSSSVDILWPVQALLHIMVADLTLSFQRAMTSCSNQSAPLITDFISCLTSSTTAIAAANLREDPLEDRVHAIIAGEAGQSALSLLYISAMAKYSIKEFESSQTHKLLSLYDKVWQLWTRDCIRQQKEAEERAQEFKTRRQDITIKSDEEIEEEELQALFPSYENNTPPTSSHHSSANLVTPAQISLLCKIHLSIMSTEAAEEKSTSFDSLRQQIVVSMVEKHGLALPSVLDQTSLAFQFHSLCQLLKSSTAPSNSQTNFYTGSNTSETTRVVPLVKALASRIDALIEQWPEMTNLDEILQRCRKIAALSSDSPLALIIPQLEALIGQIEEWQKYSCTENSLLSFQTELTALVVNWRRLELGSWAALIQTELDSFQSTTDVWWFRLYELLVRGYSTHSHTPETQEAKSYLKDCALVLSQFITECNLGQFGSRLALLDSFSALLRAVCQISGFGCWTRINDLLNGVIYFYSHYAPLVDQKIEQAKRLARGEIENYIQLASWKDINIIALRQSSQKSHRQLYKTVRKFRSVLQGPMKDMLQRWQVKKSGDVEARLPSILQQNDPSGRDGFDLLLWNQYTKSLSMPAYFSQPQNILKRLQKLIHTNNFLSPEVTNAASEVGQLSTHIFSVAKELSEVKIPRGDGRERFARNLDLRKRKAFSELLKKLRLLGIGTSPTDRLLLQLSDPAVVMSQPLLGRESLPEVKLCCEDSDELLFGLLNEMPQFRKYRSQHHSDIPNADMERLIGSIESGLALILAERQTLSALVNAIKPIEQSLVRMLSLLDSTAFCTSKTTDNQLCDISKRIIQHQKLCGSAIEEASTSITQLTDRRQGRDPTDITHILREMIVTIAENESHVKDIAKFSGTSLTLLKPNEAEALRNIDANMQGISNRLKSLALDFPDFDFILSPLARQLSHYQTTIPNLVCSDGYPSEKAWKSLKKFTDSVLVVIQDLAKTKEPQLDLLKSKKAPGLLRKAHAEFASFSAQCHLEEISGNLSNFKAALSLTSNSPEISLLLNMAASFLQQYLHLISNHLLDYLRWHRSNLHLVHTIISIGANIAEQGFCKPDFSEEDDSAGKDGPSKDGTGLGGGQGAKDVSDEIEDEEQLEGLQGEAEEEKREADQDATKEDKAVETQQDFDASLEDVENADEGDSNTDDEDEADDEIEDGVGKVDPLDSGAVDEKFWEGGDEAGDEPESNDAELSAKENQPMPQDSDLTAQENTVGGEQNKAKNNDDPETTSPKENEASELDDNGEGGEDNPDQQNESPDAEEDNKDEVPGQDNAVPMMDHVDNSEVLDLPENLELEDNGSEASSQDSIMDHEDSVPEPPEGHDTEVDDAGEAQSPPDRDMEDYKSDQPSGEPQPEDNPSGQGKDNQSGAGTGTDGGEALSTPAIVDPIENLDENADNEKPHMDEQKSASAANDSTKEKLPAQALQPQSSEQVGDGSNGPAVSQEQGPTDNCDDTNKDTTRPNPLRNLGNAMEDWKQRLQQIIDSSPEEGKEGGEERFDDTAEVEYLQTDDNDIAHQQAPGPATEEQACEGLVNMEIDDCEPEADIPRPPVSNSTPHPVEPLQAPETGDQSDLAEAAILGSKSEPQTTNDLQMHDSRFENEPPEDQEKEDDDPAESTNLKSENGPLHDPTTSLALWRKYQQLTQRSASHLTEQLRLILEPTTATCLQGDYRTGKRLNMRKLVPYIASDYTKDRIWLRRTKPAQRDYKILLAVDDSRSMADSRCADLAFQTLAMVTSALSKLEVGQVAIAKFGGSFDMLQPFEGSSAKLNNSTSPIEGFTFSQQQTNVRLAVAKAVEAFSLAQPCGNSFNDNETWKLGIIISDGICQDHEEVRSLLRKAGKDKIMFVFLILDSLHQHMGTSGTNEEGAQGKDHHPNDSSIISMNSVSYVTGPNGQMELKMERYLDTFPFDYYIILRDVEALPNVLSSTLRQFLEKVNNV